MIEYSTFTLDNGLRVVHHHDASTSHVTVNMLYDVGSRDESPELTGMAHLFEHLMFGGSVNIPDYSTVIELAGGSDNAWTSPDYTNFYEVLPAENVETAFYAESDRMLALAFTPESLEVQRSVVMEEFKQVCLNKPFGDIGHHLRRLLYRVHPYRYPTIGKELAHIEKVTLDDIRRFFYSHYAPNNAVLSVAGPVSLEQVRAMTLKWFGDIPRRDITPRVAVSEPPITAARREEVTGRVPYTRIVIAFHTEAYGTRDYRVADIITDILSSGQSARFNRELVLGTDLFTSADAAVAGSAEPGYLMVAGALRDDAGPDAVQRAEQAIWQQLERLAVEPVTDMELQRALNRFESSRTFSMINCRDKALELAKAVMNGEDVNSVVDSYRTITPDDILRVARDMFRHERSATLIYAPE